LRAARRSPHPARSSAASLLLPSLSSFSFARPLIALHPTPSLASCKPCPTHLHLLLRLRLHSPTSFALWHFNRAAAASPAALVPSQMLRPPPLLCPIRCPTPPPSFWPSLGLCRLLRPEFPALPRLPLVAAPSAAFISAAAPQAAALVAAPSAAFISAAAPPAAALVAAPSAAFVSAAAPPAVALVAAPSAAFVSAAASPAAALVAAPSAAPVSAAAPPAAALVAAPSAAFVPAAASPAAALVAAPSAAFVSAAAIYSIGMLWMLMLCERAWHLTLHPDCTTHRGFFARACACACTRVCTCTCVCTRPLRLFVQSLFNGVIAPAAMSAKIRFLMNCAVGLDSYSKRVLVVMSVCAMCSMKRQVRTPQSVALP